MQGKYYRAYTNCNSIDHVEPKNIINELTHPMQNAELASNTHIEPLLSMRLKARDIDREMHSGANELCKMRLLRPSACTKCGWRMQRVGNEGGNDATMNGRVLFFMRQRHIKSNRRK